jgi:hypothetical protein
VLEVTLKHKNILIKMNGLKCICMFYSQSVWEYMRFHNDDSNAPDLCIKLILMCLAALSDFPAYETNKTLSALCSTAARPAWKYHTKMFAWIGGFYQKTVLKLTEFAALW